MAQISTASQSIQSHLLSILVPSDILASFEITQVIENDSELLIELTEKEDIVPSYLKGKNVSLDGYMNATTLQHYPQMGKNYYIHLKRRRWKEKGVAKSKSYHNEYSFTADGTMATKSFGAFLKRNSLINTPSRLAQLQSS
jgi:hypothetical protein